MPDDRGYKWKEGAARIREARARVGLTQREVSELLGVSAHTVWCWEAGKTKPSNEHLVELASRCEVSTDWLLGRESVEAEVLEEAEVSFRSAVANLPREDIEEIKNFIAFVREQRRRKG
ncbi:MAG: helix-turn-helix transcriptional regulator [Chloroflexota bacterium]|nr:helix-turn-helix transcriptional regulator [Chloroflexota bacterium]